MTVEDFRIPEPLCDYCGRENVLLEKDGQRKDAMGVVSSAMSCRPCRDAHETLLVHQRIAKSLETLVEALVK